MQKKTETKSGRVVEDALIGKLSPIGQLTSLTPRITVLLDDNSQIEVEAQHFKDTPIYGSKVTVHLKEGKVSHCDLLK